MRVALLLFAASAAWAAKPEYTAGVAVRKITPDKPIWMSGYGNRTHASEGVLADLWAKALAIRDSGGSRAVIVTTDLLGLTRAITDEVCARSQKQWGLERSQVLFNSSHTHTGPLVSTRQVMFALNEADTSVVDAYTRTLTDALVDVIGASLEKMEPASLSWSAGSAGFAVNRRQFTKDGVKIGVQPDGPKDHSVPVVTVRVGGQVKAILFGYACHNTTIGHYRISGDYAGFAQIDVEKKFPGATALFLLLCGGDQNPNPRGTDDLARQHGAALADGVASAVGANDKPVHGRIRAAFQLTDLAFRVHTREDFEKESKHPTGFNQRRAQAMLAAYDSGHPVRTLVYPVQAIRFGRGPAILALGGEVVIDYSIRAKKEFPRENLIVAGYSNDVACYIPSKRVLDEGGYEADSSMIYYGMPGPFSGDVEERVFGAIRSVMKRVGAR